MNFTWQNFFRVCTEEMDDLSLKATKLVIEYCLEILDEAKGKITGKPSLDRLGRTSAIEIVLDAGFSGLAGTAPVNPSDPTSIENAIKT